MRCASVERDAYASLWKSAKSSTKSKIKKQILAMYG
jgi:hypothetical protein